MQLLHPFHTTLISTDEALLGAPVVLITSDWGIEFLNIVKMVADALVYHPVVDHYLKFVATTGERNGMSFTSLSF